MHVIVKLSIFNPLSFNFARVLFPDPYANCKTRKSARQRKNRIGAGAVTKVSNRSNLRNPRRGPKFHKKDGTAEVKLEVDASKGEEISYSIVYIRKLYSINMQSLVRGYILI